MATETDLLYLVLLVNRGTLVAGERNLPKTCLARREAACAVSFAGIRAQPVIGLNGLAYGAMFDHPALIENQAPGTERAYSTHVMAHKQHGTPLMRHLAHPP